VHEPNLFHRYPKFYYFGSPSHHPQHVGDASTVTLTIERDLRLEIARDGTTPHGMLAPWGDQPMVLRARALDGPDLPMEILPLPGRVESHDHQNPPIITVLIVLGFPLFIIVTSMIEKQYLKVIPRPLSDRAPTRRLTTSGSKRAGSGYGLCASGLFSYTSG
jgi:hypothetical protein